MNASPEMNPKTQQPSGQESGTQPRAIVTAAVLLALASAAIPIALVKPWVGMGLWAAMLAGCVFLFRRMRLGVTLTLIASGTLFLLSGSYLFVGPLATALAVGTFAGAFLMTTLKKPYFVCLIPLLSVVVTVAFTRDWFLLAAALSLLPAGALTAYATRKGMGRTSIICFGAGGLLGAALILFVLAMVRSGSGVSLETVQSLIAEWKAGLLAEQKEMRDALLEMLERAYANSGTAGTESAQKMLDYYRRLMSDATLENELTRVFNVLPGAVAAIALVAAFLGQRLLLEGYEAAGMRSKITPESEFLVLSLPAAVIYVICLILSLIFDYSYSVPVVTAENLLLILTPGFCAVGWHAWVRFFRSVPPRGRGVMLIPAIALLCCASGSILYVLAAYGAYTTVFSAVRRAAMRRGGPGPQGPSDGDGGDGNPFD